MKSVKLFWILLIITTFAARAQQDPQYSQNIFNHLAVNPGIAGNSGLINASLLNRFQWVGFPGAPQTTAFDIDASLKLIGENDGLGLSVVNDVAGYEKSVSLGVNYSWRTKVGNGMLGSGISLGVLNKKLTPDWNSEEGGDIVNGSDPALPQQEVNGNLLEIGAGLFYNHKNYYLGLSVTHLNQATFSFEEEGQYSVKRHYYFTGGYSFPLDGGKIEVTPSFFLKSDAVNHQIDATCLVKYDNRILGGIGFRPNDAVIILLGTELQNGLKLGYSYDISTSALSAYNSGSHELFVAYSIAFNKKKTHKYKSVRFL